MRRYFLACILILSVAISSCSPDAVKNYEAVNNGSVTKVTGAWTGVSANQRDVGAENKNFPYKSMDVTAPLQFNNVKLTLNGTNSGAFTINYGTAPQFFKFNSGNWSVDNQEKVGKIYLVNGTDTMTLVMGSYNLLLQNKMQLTLTKTLLGKPAIIYEFLFSK